MILPFLYSPFPLQNQKIHSGNPSSFSLPFQESTWALFLSIRNNDRDFLMPLLPSKLTLPLNFQTISAHPHREEDPDTLAEWS